MSTACALALLLVASAPSTEAPVDKDTPVRCDEERATCRDGCSLDFGTSMDTREKIATCLNQCDERRDICLLRIVAKQRANAAPERKAAPEAAKRPPPGQQPATPYTLPPTGYSRTPVRAEDAPPEELPPAHRTATSASELSDSDAPPPAPAPRAESSGAPSETKPAEAKPAKTSKKKRKHRAAEEAP